MNQSGRRGRSRLISEINVTPLVDVVLVLLVIFMLAAPVLFRNAIKVKLPEASHGEKSSDSPMTFVLDRDGKLFFNNQAVEWDKLAGVVQGFMQADKSQKDPLVVVSADKDSRHGNVIRLMDTLKGLGLNRFSLNVSRPGGNQ